MVSSRISLLALLYTVHNYGINFGVAQQLCEGIKCFLVAQASAAIVQEKQSLISNLYNIFMESLFSFCLFNP